MPTRVRRGRTLIVILSICASILLLLVSFVLWQWRTIGFILNPDTIHMRPGNEIRASLYSGIFEPITVNSSGSGEIISYRVLDGTVEITAEPDSSRFEARFNAFAVPIASVPDAFRKAGLVLSPYLGKDESEALIFLLASDLAGYLPGLDYRREFGSLTVTAGGSPEEILLTVEKGVSP